MSYPNVSNKDSCYIDMSFLDPDDDQVVDETSPSLPFILLSNTEHSPQTHSSSSSTFSINDLLDDAASMRSSSSDSASSSSSLSINELLDGAGSMRSSSSDSASTSTSDLSSLVIDMPLPQATHPLAESAASSDTVSTVDDISIDVPLLQEILGLDPLLSQIQQTSKAYQLDALLAELFQTDGMSAEQVMQRMQAYSNRHEALKTETSPLYQCYMSLHQQLETILPYPFRAGGNISMHLLFQTLFFNGKFKSTDATALAYAGFLSSTLPLTMDQVRSFGDTMTALFFHFPSILYQYPKLRDEVMQCVEKGSISGSLISRIVMCAASTMLTISPIVMLGGSMQAGNIVRWIGRAISYADIPIVVVTLLESWYNLYKYGGERNTAHAQRFVSHEAAFKTTQRVLLQALSLFSSLSGSILRAMGRGTASEIATLFAINILNLFFHQNPFEGQSMGAGLLKRATYQHSPSLTSVQTVALLADLTRTQEMTAPLRCNTDRIHYAMNMPRLDADRQIAFLNAVMNACSTGERPSLTQAQVEHTQQIINAIYEEPYNPYRTEGLPPVFVQFMDYLAELRAQDVSSCSMGNAVNEKLIATLIKTLAFRETVANVTTQQ